MRRHWQVESKQTLWDHTGPSIYTMVQFIISSMHQSGLDNVPELAADRVLWRGLIRCAVQANIKFPQISVPARTVEVYQVVSASLKERLDRWLRKRPLTVAFLTSCGLAWTDMVSRYNYNNKINNVSKSINILCQSCSHSRGTCFCRTWHTGWWSLYSCQHHC